ncbi:uncharacterized protein [Dermacentor albipictus]|uniref:uncharacterized protein isoform X2 n=1 Tax=Dermacentor albipictus TaxID=60249 RepID=UPI0038FC537B
MGKGKECTDGCPDNAAIYTFDSFRLEATSESEPQQFCLTFKRDRFPTTDFVTSFKPRSSATYKVKYTTGDNTTREDSANVTMLESEVNVYFKSRESGDPLPVKMRFIYYIECFVIEQPSQGASCSP